MDSGKIKYKKKRKKEALPLENDFNPGPAGWTWGERNHIYLHTLIIRRLESHKSLRVRSVKITIQDRKQRHY